MSRQAVDLVAGFETGANDELDVYTNNDLSACTPLPSNGNAIVSLYAADVISAQDYAPFGMEMVGRKYNNGAYRYGFNGQEESDEIKSEGNSYTAEFWEYDPRLGRRWNVDPVSNQP